MEQGKTNVGPIISNNDVKIVASQIGNRSSVSACILHSLSPGGNNSHKAKIVRSPPGGIKGMLFCDFGFLDFGTDFNILPSWYREKEKTDQQTKFRTYLLKPRYHTPCSYIV